jgi:hypothetical protein
MPPLEGVEVGEMDESQAVELFFRGGRGDGLVFQETFGQGLRMA